MYFVCECWVSAPHLVHRRFILPSLPSRPCRPCLIYPSTYFPSNLFFLTHGPVPHGSAPTLIPNDPTSRPHAGLLHLYVAQMIHYTKHTTNKHTSRPHAGRLHLEQIHQEKMKPTYLWYYRYVMGSLCEVQLARVWTT